MLQGNSSYHDLDTRIYCTALRYYGPRKYVNHVHIHRNCYIYVNALPLLLSLLRNMSLNLLARENPARRMSLVAI